jgi:hypothetical protein
LELCSLFLEVFKKTEITDDALFQLDRFIKRALLKYPAKIKQKEKYSLLRINNSHKTYDIRITTKTDGKNKSLSPSEVLMLKLNTAGINKLRSIAIAYRKKTFKNSVFRLPVLYDKKAIKATAIKTQIEQKMKVLALKVGKTNKRHTDLKKLIT